MVKANKNEVTTKLDPKIAVKLKIFKSNRDYSDNKYYFKSKTRNTKFKFSKEKKKGFLQSTLILNDQEVDYYFDKYNKSILAEFEEKERTKENLIKKEIFSNETLLKSNKDKTEKINIAIKKDEKFLFDLEKKIKKNSIILKKQCSDKERQEIEFKKKLEKYNNLRKEIEKISTIKLTITNFNNLKKEIPSLKTEKNSLINEITASKETIVNFNRMASFENLEKNTENLEIKTNDLEIRNNDLEEICEEIREEIHSLYNTQNTLENNIANLEKMNVIEDLDIHISNKEEHLEKLDLQISNLIKKNIKKLVVGISMIILVISLFFIIKTTFIKKNLLKKQKTTSSFHIDMPKFSSGNDSFPPSNQIKLESEITINKGSKAYKNFNLDSFFFTENKIIGKVIEIKEIKNKKFIKIKTIKGIVNFYFLIE